MDVAHWDEAVFQLFYREFKECIFTVFRDNYIVPKQVRNKIKCCSASLKLLSIIFYEANDYV